MNESDTNTPAPTRLSHSHPIAIAICVTVILFLVGGLLIERSGGNAAPGSVQVWGTDSAEFQDPTSLTPVASPAGQVITATTDVGAPLHIVFATTTPHSPKTAQDTDVDAFLSYFSSLAKPAAATPSVDFAMNPDIQAAYANVPTGLLSTSTSRARTPAEDAAYRYGNAAGSVIQTYEASHTTQLQVLKALGDDRGNAVKAQAVRALGADLGAMGTKLLTIQNVPASLVGAHTDLAHKYQKAGTLLAAMADAGLNDDKTIAAISAYDNAASEVTNSFIVLATSLSLSGVTFAPEDAGSVFSFPDISSF